MNRPIHFSYRQGSLPLLNAVFMYRISNTVYFKLATDTLHKVCNSSWCPTNSKNSNQNNNVESTLCTLSSPLTQPFTHSFEVRMFHIFIPHETFGDAKTGVEDKPGQIKWTMAEKHFIDSKFIELHVILQKMCEELSTRVKDVTQLCFFLSYFLLLKMVGKHLNNQLIYGAQTQDDINHVSWHSMETRRQCSAWQLTISSFVTHRVNIMF